MDRQTLRDWVHRYNAEGLAGLTNRRGTGRPRRLTPEQMTELAGWVEAGPDPEQDGVVRWRRKDLARRIQAEFGVDLHERTVGKHLVALGFTGSRCARSIRNRTRRHKTFLKRLSGGGSGSANIVFPRSDDFICLPELVL